MCDQLSITRTGLVLVSAAMSMSSRDTLDYDFESEDNYKKWKGQLVPALEDIQKRVHGLTANNDALEYVETLILRLLSNLVNNQVNSVADVEERVHRLFPYPLDKWAIAKANETIQAMKPHHKRLRNATSNQPPVRMNIEKIHTLLKDVFGHNNKKDDRFITIYLVAILEYIAADIFQLAGHYVKSLRHTEITCQDIKVCRRPL